MMLSEVFTWLNSLLSGNIWAVLTGSFLWGVLSILLSPCHLSTIPLIIGYISQNENLTVNRSFRLSIAFSVGILITVALIGLITAALGRLMGDVGSAGNYIVPAVFIAAGLYLLDVIKFQFGSFSNENLKATGGLKALTLGLAIGIGLGPCTFAFMAPVLGIVFKTAQFNVAVSLLIMLLFALGHCLVIAGAGALSRYIQIFLNWNENSKAISVIRKICGLFVVLSGIYLLITALDA